jgi:hypothetical protein
MKHIKVPLIAAGYHASMTEISQQLDESPFHPIDIAPWPKFAYRPGVKFSIAHGTDAVFLKYSVNEKFVRAIYDQPNDPVYKESCVEFFISFKQEEEYYNFEFNAAGTCLAGFGRHRNDRRMLPHAAIRSIRHQSLLKPVATDDANVCWELTLAMPLSAFHYHKLITVSQITCRVNFYKCGDELPEPHYVVWNNIEAPQPDFHLRDFFGSAEFT